MRKLLIDTLSVQSESFKTERMELFIMDKLNEMGVPFVYDKGNIYATKGEATDYPCMVSHTDTVHKIIDDRDFCIIADNDFAIGFDKLNMTPSGCGGDDKVGIFMCLQLLKDLDYLKVAFFRDEEVGCNGSYDADVEFFDDVRFILQCDRKGNTDFVNNIYGTNLASDEFNADVSHIIDKYGYSFTSGMLTDVYALASIGVNVSVANMSCGYYNPHCDDEVVSFADVQNCFDMCYEIITSMPFVYKIDRSVKDKSWKYDWEDKRYNDDWYKGHVIADSVCDDCGIVTEQKNLTYWKDFNAHLCPVCNEGYIEYSEEAYRQGKA